MIFISTGEFHQKPSLETVSEFLQKGINEIELSGGQYSKNLFRYLEQLKGKATFQLHNYFPICDIPFVFNLASTDKLTAKASIRHAFKAIEWSEKLDGAYYSFHAGLLFDPEPKELGKTIKRYELANRDMALKLFIERVNQVDEVAQIHGIKLLIENNVLSQANFRSFGVNPSLMTTPEETDFIMEHTSSNVNLLIDVAHLKVNGNTLGYDPTIILTNFNKWIQGYHLSDNNGKWDSNSPIRDNSWFWPYLKKNLDYYSIEVYGLSKYELYAQRNLIEKHLN